MDVGLFSHNGHASDETEFSQAKVRSTPRHGPVHCRASCFVCGVKGRLATDQRDFWVRIFKSCRIAFMSCNCLLTLAKRALSSSKLSLSS